LFLKIKKTTIMKIKTRKKIKLTTLVVGFLSFFLHSPAQADVVTPTHIPATNRTISCQHITPLCENANLPKNGAIYQTCCEQSKASTKLLKLQNDHLKLMSKFLTETSDSDTDGVVNMSDKCPNTPPNTTVDFKGCTIDNNRDGIPDLNVQCLGNPDSTQLGKNGCVPDTDGDGINDNKDQCPNSPKNIPIDETGCMVDFDKDGIGDLNDQCIDTSIGATINANGCEIDSDKDGITDSKDLCNNTVKDTPVNTVGCKKNENLMLTGVNFAPASDALLPTSLQQLKAIAATLKHHPNIKLEIAGHTDSKGKKALNLVLSHKRATMVKNYFVSKGLNEKQITAVGYGESQPISSNQTEQGRNENRRVELMILPTLPVKTN
jgi:outer membrane protein OmpA-like peptidoglycan-associated protein